jgi:ComF family protein
VCGAPLISELSLCLHCREEEGRLTEEGQGRFSYDMARSLFPYRGPARELMYQYKFRGRKFLASYLAWRIQECYGSLIKGFAIVPAPAEPRNLKKRGWDPVLVLARELARINGNDVEPVLGRKRSISQKGLNREERKENLKGKIYVRKSLKSRHVVILDDIWTTGATAQICSAVLKEFHPEQIMVLTVCRD